MAQQFAELAIIEALFNEEEEEAKRLINEMLPFEKRAFRTVLLDALNLLTQTESDLLTAPEH